MLDSGWELIEGDVAHEIEVLNYSNQVNVISAMVMFILHHVACDSAGCIEWPNERALKEMHRTGTLFLLRNPGEYRDGQVQVSKADGTVVHMPPAAEAVQQHMDTFFQTLGSAWPTATATQAAALSLWMVNWVHPFKNGNGRTARAFCYTVLCLKLGFLLPGSPTVIDQIMMERDAYQAALKAADVGFDETGEPDLTAMIAFLDRLLVTQLQSVPA